MFKEKMETSAIPERVYALCKIVEKKPITNAALKEKMEPTFLANGNTVYYSSYRTAAEELGLISISDDLVSLVVEPSVISSIEMMRGYVNLKLAELSQGLFYVTTKAFFEMGSEVLSKSKNVTDLGPDITKNTHIPVDAVAMRAWRFWASFLGFGFLHDMFFIPNACIFLKDIIALSSLEKDKRYSVSEFVEGIRPYCNIVIQTNPTSSQFSYGVSNGLRALHDLGFIKLEHILDQRDIWGIYPMRAHSISDTVTNITLCK